MKTVGEPYVPGKSNWPNSMEYFYHEKLHELRIFLDDLKENEINAVQNDPCELGIFIHQYVIFFLFKFVIYTDSKPQVILGGECPHLSYTITQGEKHEPEGDEMSPLNIHLVDAKSGIIKATRLITLSEDFFNTFKNAIKEQNDNETDKETFFNNIKKIYTEYPPNAMWENATICLLAKD